MNVTDQSLNPWVMAAQNLTPAPALQALAPDAARELPVFLAAHGGAGATSWAHILGGIDGGQVSDLNQDTTGPEVEIVLVARASIDGIDAAKSAIAIHGYERFVCVLLVPSAAGKMPRPIANEVKVLSGAVTIITAPWSPSLLVRRAAQLNPTAIAPKELNKIIAGLTEAGITIEGQSP